LKPGLPDMLCRVLKLSYTNILSKNKLLPSEKMNAYKTLIIFALFARNLFHKPELLQSNHSPKTWLQAKNLIDTRNTIRKIKKQKECRKQKQMKET
jgi:hypothetical protein